MKQTDSGGRKSDGDCSKCLKKFENKEKKKNFKKSVAILKKVCYSSYR
jgi:hypothetical protein